MEFPVLIGVLFGILTTLWTINSNIRALNENILRMHNMLENQPNQRDFFDEESHEIAKAARSHNDKERRREFDMR